MSARVSLGAPLKGPVRSSQRRKMVLDVDLNAPPYENCNEVGTSSHAPVVREVPSIQQGPPPQPVAIDVDCIDDDVILSSPRAFAEVLLCFFVFGIAIKVPPPSRHRFLLAELFLCYLLTGQK